MDNQVLDAEIRQKERKPISSTKAGIVTGLLCAALLAFIHYNNSHRAIPFVIPDFGIWIIFLIPCQIIVAALGDRKQHYLHIVKSGVVASLLAVIPGLVNQIINSETDYEYGRCLGVGIGFLFSSTIISMVSGAIFWVIPGKLPFFSNRISRPDDFFHQNP